MYVGEPKGMVKNVGMLNKTQRDKSAERETSVKKRGMSVVVYGILRAIFLSRDWGDSRSSRQCTSWVWVRDCQGQALRIDEEDGKDGKDPAAGIMEHNAMYVRYDNSRIVALAFLEACK